MRQISGTCFDRAVGSGDLGLQHLARLQPVARPRMVTVSSPLRPSVCQDVPSSKTSGSTPMPTRLERWMRSKLSAIDGAHAEQPRALGRPVARGAGAVFLAGEDDQRHALGLVAHRRVVDRHDLAVGLVHGDAAFDARRPSGS